MIEEWRAVTVPAFAGLYEISNLGRVRGVARTARSKGNGTRAVPAKEIATRVGKRGYLMVFLSAGEVRRNIAVHRLVAGAFIPNPENLPEINHVDLNKANAVFTNLEWTSHLGNIKHAVANGRHPMKRKLTTEDIAAIKAMAETSAQNEIASAFGIRQSTVSRIVNGLRRHHD